MVSPSVDFTSAKYRIILEKAYLKQVNCILFLEIVWFMIINAVTGYVLLYKGFEWPRELGQIQRFIW